MARDLPLLAEHLGRPFTSAMLKGRSNYLCRAALADAVGVADQGSLVEGAPAPAGHEVLAAVTAWAAAYTCSQALAFLNGSTPELAGATAELLAPDFTARLRFWPAHPKCGCSWLTPTEWGA